MSLSFGNSLIHLSEVDSTNEFALKLLQEVNVFNGTVIVADNQTKGKGQRGSKWLVEPGFNLTFTIVLRSIKLKAVDQFLLSKMIAIAIVNTLSDFVTETDKLKVKWPNDIFYGGKKIGGVLVENKFRGNVWDASVVGVGLNINQIIFDKSLSEIATSLAMIENKTFDKKSILDHLIIEIEKGYLILNSQSSYKNLELAYFNHLIGINHFHSYRIVNENIKIELIIKGVLSSGQVIMTDKGGKEYNFWFKEIELIL